MEEIVIYRSPLEKVWADYLMAHPALMGVVAVLFGLFFLFVFANVISVFFKVGRDMKNFDRDFNRRIGRRKDW